MPPQIDFSKIQNIPNILVSGTSDMFANYMDIREFYEEIKQSVVSYMEFNVGHGSIIYGSDLSFFYDDIME